MRISYLASAALAVCFLPLSTSAYASCSSPTCSAGSGITYGSGSYNSGSSVTMYNSGSASSHSAGSRYSSGNSAPCPAGSSRSEGVCMSSGSSSSVGISTATSYGGASHSSGSTYAFGSSYTSSSTSNAVPFSTSTSNISNYRIAGMGSNESLVPTTCPTSVYNPTGAKVLGCYSVVKPTPAPRPAPVVVPQVNYQHVRVVRPIIYVRYPVPTPVAVPVYQQQYSQQYRQQFQGGCGGITYSRYGNNWPRLGAGCGGW